MKPFLFLLAGVLLLTTTVRAAGPENTKLAELRRQRAETAGKLEEKRMAYIRTDRDLARLHKEIMNKHREMAIRLDAKPDVRALNTQMIELDARIEFELKNGVKK